MADADPTEAMDPRGVIREAYRIPGIDAGQCRSIFLDWALGRPDGGVAAARALHAHYAPRHPDHPMTATLAEAAGPAPEQRRGARSARRRGRG